MGFFDKINSYSLYCCAQVQLSTSKPYMASIVFLYMYILCKYSGYSDGKEIPSQERRVSSIERIHMIVNIDLNSIESAA